MEEKAMSNFKSKMVKLGLAMSLLVVMVLSATMMLPHNSNFTQIRAAQQNGEIERVVSAQHETVSVPQQEARRNIPAYARCSISGNFVAEDYTILDTTRIDDYFADDRILLVMSRRESRNFRDYSVSDFPEVRLSSVECLTPGLDMARNQLKASGFYKGEFTLF